VLVTDLSIPSSNRDSFEGGFELVERLAAIDRMAPVMLMAETLSSAARARAKELRVRKVAFKPALTKLDPEEYRADLRSFSKVLKRELAELLILSRWNEPESGSDPELNHDVIFDFLRTMTAQLTSPTNGIARMILRVASKYVERALLFLIKDAEAKGLAGVRQGEPLAESMDAARRMSFPLQQHRPFAEVVYSREPVWLDDTRELATEVIEPGHAREAALFPLLLNHEVLAVLYCDNPNSGAPLTRLAGLQLFLAQAGMALENASLHRKIRSLEHRYSLEDQGPLTEELTPIVRNIR
jgi:GAF domain-containing protein